MPGCLHSSSLFSLLCSFLVHRAPLSCSLPCPPSFPHSPIVIFGTNPVCTGVGGPPRGGSLRKRCKFINIGREKKSSAPPPGACPLRVAPSGAQRPRPRPLAGSGAYPPLGRAPKAPRRGRGPGSQPPPATHPHAAESRPSHGPASAAAGGIEDRGLRRPPGVCPAPAPAAAVPNLRYTCELASCPGGPAPRANRRSAALHPKCGI